MVEEFDALLHPAAVLREAHVLEAAGHTDKFSIRMLGRLTAYERDDMVLLGKMGFQNSNPPATVIHRRAHSGEVCSLAHRGL